MKVEDTSINRFFDALRQRRWLMVAAFIMMLAGLELTRSYINAQYDFDQAYRVLLFGVALPLLVGIALSIPSRFKMTQTLTSQSRGKVKRRVLVATKEMLLGAGIESLLIGQKELDFIGIISNSNIELIKKINRLKPEVVILDENMYLLSAKELLAYMDKWPEMRLVVVSANENRMQVYNKRQFQVTQSMDLVEMMCRT